MRKLNELTFKEITELVFELFDDEKAEEILKLSKDEIIEIIETDEKCIIDTDSSDKTKHSPSRKKKSNRVKKGSIQYKKNKDKKWKEKRRSSIISEDTNNRSFINKSTKRYNKLQPRKKSKVKNS